MKKKESIKSYDDTGTFYTGTYIVEYDDDTPSPHDGIVTSTNPRWPNASGLRKMNVSIGTKVSVYR